MTKVEIVKMDVSLKEKIALAIIVRYFKTFIDSQSADNLLLGEKFIQESFIKGFLNCKDIGACCEELFISPIELESFLYEISLDVLCIAESPAKSKWLERVGEIRQAIASLKKSENYGSENLSSAIIKKQFKGMLGSAVRPNMKANLERFITDFVKECRTMGFEADEITGFLVEIFHELGYTDVAIPNPRPQFRLPLPIPNQAF
jgi:hypothetical protein